MDFNIPTELTEELVLFKAFVSRNIAPNLSTWYREGSVPRDIHMKLSSEGYTGFEMKEERLSKRSTLRAALLGEYLATISPGVAVVALAHVDLGITSLALFGSDHLQQKYGPSALTGENLICLGNSERDAGSDVANISMSAEKVDGGWQLNGTKAYVTNGLISDHAVITAVSDPEASRNSRMSMYLVDLKSKGISRRKLNKQVWIPSDLSRIQLDDVFVPDDHLLGVRGQGLQQVLTVFTYSRVPISALTLGTAEGAFELALDHAMKRKVLGRQIVEHESKAYEFADYYASIEAARLMLYKACWELDKGKDFRLESSLAKYLTVKLAKEVTVWAADMFGAASVIFEHPIHKFPMDAWASSLGEGTQDVQKLVIFREMLKRHK